jgi:hypothetical protein
MINNIETRDFSIFTQKLLEVKDEHSFLKNIRERNNIVTVLTAALADREVLITWDDNGKEFSAVASLVPTGNNAPVLPAIPEEFDTINGKQVPAQKHIAFYIVPGETAELLHVDKITSFITRRDGMQYIINNL